MRSQQPTNEQTVSAMFNRIAPRYDFLNALLSMRQDRRWRKKLIAAIPYRPDGVFADIATGTGDIVLAAQQARQEYSQFVGIDIADQMLHFARQKAKRRITAQPPRFEVGSAENLNLAASSCDCISIAFGLRNVIDKENALQEFFRVLKPGGEVLVLEFFKLPDSLFAKLFLFYFHRILPMVGGLLSDREAYRYLPESVEGFQSIEDHIEQGREAGFVLRRTYRFLFGACYLVHLQKPEHSMRDADSPTRT